MKRDNTAWWESEADIIWQAEMLGLEEMIVRDAEGGLVNKEELVDAITEIKVEGLNGDAWSGGFAKNH